MFLSYELLTSSFFFFRSWLERNTIFFFSFLSLPLHLFFFFTSSYCRRSRTQFTANKGLDFYFSASCAE